MLKFRREIYKKVAKRCAYESVAFISVILFLCQFCSSFVKLKFLLSQSLLIQWVYGKRYSHKFYGRLISQDYSHGLICKVTLREFSLQRKGM